VLIDATGGLRALGERKLETVGEADKRFGEDALRVIRGLRIVNVLNHQLSTKLFDFTNTTRESIRRNVALLAYVAKERIKDELTKVFIKGNPF
jgi:tRNA nucleotidyltransferase (CCA-adding enzyme)